jgi:hypothetical protein
MFTVVDGEIEITFRGEKLTARAGDTVNVPANAPHQFTNAAEAPARLLCMCEPAGQEEFFREIGDPGRGDDRGPRRVGGLKPPAAVVGSAGRGVRPLGEGRAAD